MSEEPQLVRGVVVAHGDMARGLISAVRRIAGSAADSLEPLSNAGKSPEVLRQELDELAGEDPVVVFVDLSSGSCGIAALACCRGKVRRALIGGVNLPMLLDFAFNRGTPLPQLVRRLVEKGRDAIDHPLDGP